MWHAGLAEDVDSRLSLRGIMARRRIAPVHPGEYPREILEELDLSHPPTLFVLLANLLHPNETRQLVILAHAINWKDLVMNDDVDSRMEKSRCK